jgi:hypothetical protein
MSNGTEMEEAMSAPEEREPWQVMMSAHALCPTELSHPDKMRWMADYFLRAVSETKGDSADFPGVMPRCTFPRCACDMAIKVCEMPATPDAEAVVKESLAHSDHPMRVWDRTCPACNPEAEALENLRRQVREADAAFVKLQSYLAEHHPHVDHGNGIEDWAINALRSPGGADARDAVPEGCTPADAMALREGNFALAQELELLRQAVIQAVRDLAAFEKNSGIFVGRLNRVLLEALPDDYAALAREPEGGGVSAGDWVILVLASLGGAVIGVAIEKFLIRRKP